ncbi:MAG: hypothetical protein A2Y33_11380 [Spirochaetes bacterium GWF1_51_8]|nr:MAG: hypothetical protein A2Y33_11380 [Spirochaetes bacterium GWF1_51_8]
MFRALTVFFALVFLSPLVSSVYAVTMKAYVIIEDQYNYKKLNEISQGVRVNYQNLKKIFRVLEENNILEVQETVIKGKNATKKNVLKGLQNLKVERDEILLVYFAGHGGMKKGKTFFSTAEGGTIFRKDFEDLVKDKPAKFILLITDACSASIEALQQKKGLLDSVTPPKVKVDPEIYKNLFLNYKGFLHITAASEGEFAWVSPVKGGYFSHALFYQTLYRNPQPTWEKVIEKAKSITQKAYKDMYKAGKIPKKVMKEIKELGIKGQNPLVYSMPEMIDAPAQWQEIDHGKQFEVEIKNLTGIGQTVYLDVPDSGTVKLAVNPGKSIELVKSWPIKIAFSAKANQLITLPNGKYVLTLDRNNEIDIITEKDYIAR